MFRRLLLVAAVLLLATPSFAQTPTPVTVATPGADTGVRVDLLAPQVGGLLYSNPVELDGGLQVGTTAAGASLVTFFARGSCLVDPSASLGDGAETIVSCAHTGAAASDTVLGSIATTSDVTDVYIKRATAFTDSVQFALGSYTAAQNPGSLEIRYVVLR